jgi:hypothetical protein
MAVSAAQTSEFRSGIAHFSGSKMSLPKICEETTPLVIDGFFPAITLNLACIPLGGAVGLSGWSDHVAIETALR